MNVKPNYVVIAVSILVVAMVAVALIAMIMRSIETGSPTPTPITTGGVQPTSSPASSPAAHEPRQSSQTTIVQSSKISILSPVALDKWVIGQNNLIRWSGAAKISGSIYLVNALIKNESVPVGWIIPNIGPQQTSYTWDTRDVFLSRTNPAKKNLETGTYIIKIKFDSKVMPEVSSPTFSIIYPSEVVIPVYDVHINNFKFSPPTLTLKKGDKIKITNDDAVELRVLLSSFSPFVLKPGESFVFDTSVFSSGGLYTFYSDVYSSMVLKVTVQ